MESPPSAAAASTTVLSEGFESGAPGWGLSGFWHIQDHPETVGVVSPAINPTLVTLPDAGQLPTAFSGSHAAWFGQASTGTFCGADFNTIPQSPKNGCTSTSVESGDLASPVFSLVGASTAQVSFAAWWEIESVDADAYDVMTVQFTTDGGTTWTSVGKLNPANNPAGNHDQSYSNEGLANSPSWHTYIADLSAAAGQPNVQLRFDFNTNDTLYNGFRGLLVDNVNVNTPYAQPNPAISKLSPACVLSAATRVVDLIGSNIVLNSIITLDGSPIPTFVLADTRAEFTVNQLAPGQHTVQINSPNGSGSNIATLTSSSNCDTFDCAGRMITDSPLSYDQWTLHYGISMCEGLVASQVTLGTRLMAERMSTPYLNLVTCAGTDVAACYQSPINRHITLRQNADEPQTDPSAYTHVRLFSSGVYFASPSTQLCSSNKDKKVCDHIVIYANYRVDLAPPSAGPNQAYVIVNQRDEFYHDFAETGNADVSCEPSQNAQYGIAFIGTALPDCGRFKPIVTYTYVGGSSGQVLVSMEAAERLHFTPDSAAIRASNFLRDCDPGAPHDNCGPPILQKIETFPNGGDPIPTETVVRAVDGTEVGPDSFGRFDNLHQTDAESVELPGAQGAGCPECVHMHWRWGSDIGAPSSFGNGVPLVADGEPGAVPSTSSRQVLDVGQVAYHSEELAPYSFWDIIHGANQSDLALSHDHDHFFGGIARGDETLNYSPDSCYVPQNPATWGQCGEVTWLLARTTTAFTHDADTDTFFAFGGFFCGKCQGPLPANLNVAYSGAHGQESLRAGAPFSARLVTGPTQGFQLFDALPTGTSGVSGTVFYTRVQPRPGEQGGTPCDISTDQFGNPLVHCVVSGPVAPTATVVINGTLPSGAVTANNSVHVTWNSGNYKTVDVLTIKPAH